MWGFIEMHAQPSLRMLGDRARDKGEWDAAVALYSSELARDLRDAPLWVQYGHALKESGKLQDPTKLARAEAAYRRALIYAPRVADTHLQLGHVLKLLSRLDEAKAAYLRALALDPALGPARDELLALGWVERGGAELQAALASLDGVVPPRRRRPSWIEQADAARDAAQWALAARFYRAVLQRNPGNAGIWVQYGHALKEAGGLKDPARLATAEAAYRRALALDPGVADTHLQLGHVLKLQGKAEEAEGAYLRAFSLDPHLASSIEQLCYLGWTEREVNELRSEIAISFEDRDASQYAAVGNNRASPRAAATQRNGSQLSLEDTVDYAAADQMSTGGASVMDATISCLKRPVLRDEMALFVTHSPHGRLQPHVRHYIDALARQKIAVVLIVAADHGFMAALPDLIDRVEGAYVRQNIGFDFGAWAHVMRLEPMLTNVKILYLLNDSVFGPTNDAAFHDLLVRVRNSSADLIGLTENFSHEWHLQSYFLALKSRALSTEAFRRFVEGIVAYECVDDVISKYELKFAHTLAAAGLKCESLFPASDDRDPTVHHWEELLHLGFPFLKVKLLRAGFPDVNVSGWPQLLAAKGYDITLVEQTVSAEVCAHRTYSIPSWQIEEVLHWVEAHPGVVQERHLLSHTTARPRQAFLTRAELLRWYLTDESACDTAPNSLFDVPYFRTQYCISDNVNPLAALYHLVKDGIPAIPTPLFDPSFIERQFFARFGAAEARRTQWYIEYLDDKKLWLLKPHWLFDPQFYFQEHPDADTSDENPFTHFLAACNFEKQRSPHKAFDGEFYLANNPSVRRVGLGAWVHYVTAGWRECRKPNSFFDEYEYREVARVSSGPGLRHYLENPISGTRLLLPSSPALRWLLLNRHDAVDAAATPLEVLTHLGRAGEVPERLEEDAHSIDIRLGLWRLEPSGPLRSRQQRKLILFCETSIVTCLQYRIIEKMRMFERYSDWKVSIYDWHHPREAARGLQFANLLIIFRAPDSPETTVVVGEARRLGVPVVYEIDDLIFDVEEYRKVLRAARKEYFKVHSLENLLHGARRYRDLLLRCDWAIGTTDTIVERLNRISGLPAFRVQNALTTRQLDHAVSSNIFPRKGVQIFYGAGSPTHNEDFEEVEDPLLFILEKNSEVHLTVIGPLEPSDAFMARARSFPGRIEFVPMLNYDAYFQCISQADISIVPLSRSGGVFNDAKSNIKFLEAAFFKIPTVASNRQPFSSVIRNGVNGFSVGTTTEWRDALMALAAEPRTRQRMGLAAYETALKLYHPKQIFEREMLPCVSHIFGKDALHKAPRTRIVITEDFLDNSEVVIPKIEKTLIPGEHVVFASTARNAFFTLNDTWWRCSIGLHTVFLLAHLSEVISAELAGERMRELIAEFEPESISVLGSGPLAIAAIEAAEAAGNLPVYVFVGDASWLCQRGDMIMADGRPCQQRILDPDMCTTCVGAGFNYYDISIRKRSALLKAAQIAFEDTNLRRLYEENIPSLASRTRPAHQHAIT
jgi:tetratricopeptide (TPR) repeat protein/glycosyltransferase involved in cell wall biosynthesis